MRLMRTTLTIDPDVERLLQHEIRRTDKSLKAVVNDALRLGLGMQGKPPRGSRYKVNPTPSPSSRVSMSTGSISLLTSWRRMNWLDRGTGDHS